MSSTLKWSELTPDQRNRLVGERVMGNTYTCDVIPDFTTHQAPSRAGGIAFTYTTWLCPACGATGYYGKEALAAHEKPAPIPAYTTSLDAIKHLRQHMTERSSLLNLHLIVYAYNRCYASFSLEAPIDDREWSEGNGEHCMEEAICKAALKACGIEVES